MVRVEGWALAVSALIGAPACADRTDADDGSTSSETTSGDDAWSVCLAMKDYQACEAADCTYLSPLVSDVDPQSCAAMWHDDGLCVPRGDEPEPDERTAYYRRDGDAIVWLPHGSHCGWLDTIPPGVTRCGEGADDPPGCACFCVDDHCPWHADVDALLSCAVPEPCGVYMPNGDPEGYGGTELCFLATLRDRAVAILRVELNLGDFGENDLVYVGYAGTAMHVHESWEFGGCEPDNLHVDPARRCELQPSAYFDDCLAATDTAEQEACMTPSSWFLACADEPPTCE